MPPVLVNDQFVTNCWEKVKSFNEFFAQQCSTNENGSTLSNDIVF